MNTDSNAHKLLSLISLLFAILAIFYILTYSAFRGINMISIDGSSTRKLKTGSFYYCRNENEFIYYFYFPIIYLELLYKNRL